MLSLPVTFGDLSQIKTSLGLGFLLTEDETIPKAQTAAQASSENKRCSPACVPHPLLGENASWTPSLSAACVPNSDGADCWRQRLQLLQPWARTLGTVHGAFWQRLPVLQSGHFLSRENKLGICSLGFQKFVFHNRPPKKHYSLVFLRKFQFIVHHGNRAKVLAGVP